MRLGWAHNLPYMGKYSKATREDRRMGFAHAQTAGRSDPLATADETHVCVQASREP
jgi:hypothetical protein